MSDTDVEPDIEPLRYYVDAFRELSSCRNLGMGIGPIPFTAVSEYFKLFGEGDFEEFLYLIRAMDDKYLSLEYAKQKKDLKQPKKGKK